MYRIDINCDMGEGLGNEADLMPFVTSCNIACGGHAGDKETMVRTVDLAIGKGVLVGAHPSYPDREHFGRRSLNISQGDLIRDIRGQIGGLERVLHYFGRPMNHIKPHGALYNDLAIDRRTARIFLRSIPEYREKVELFVPYGSIIAEEARSRGFRIKYEAFADRNYNEDLTLVSRTENNALIEEPRAVLDHLVRMVLGKEVLTVSGKLIKIEADTFCIHGDAPATLQILTYLSRTLPKYKILLKK